MTPDNNNLENIKRAWKNMGENLGMQMPDDNSHNLQHKKTALDRLRNYYRRFLIFGIMFAMSSFFIFSNLSKNKQKISFPIGRTSAKRKDSGWL